MDNGIMQLPEIDARCKTQDAKEKNSLRLKSKILNLKSNFGFTLIELLVVVFIIGLLITLTTVSYTKTLQKGRDNKRKSDLQNVKQSLESYFNANGKYPANSASNQIQCNIPPTYTATKDWGGVFVCDQIYLALLPKDPTGATEYSYTHLTDFTFILQANLENSNDPDLNNMGCTADLPTYNYCIVNP